LRPSLGVLLSDGCFALSKPRKRKRFDWLYERAIEQEALDHLLNYLELTDLDLLCRIKDETDHDKRAALVCLLTAMCVASRAATSVGDANTGYFWLPPQELWAEWALEAYSRSHLRQCV
jgi:predicted RNase H-like nuclease